MGVAALLLWICAPVDYFDMVLFSTVLRLQYLTHSHKDDVKHLMMVVVMLEVMVDMEMQNILAYCILSS